MKCTHCHAEIAARALICYRCGQATTEPRIKPPAERSLFERPRRSRWPLVLVIVLVLALLLAWFLLDGATGAFAQASNGGQAPLRSGHPLLDAFGDALERVADAPILGFLDGEIT
jgi:hypothetical protein